MADAKTNLVTRFVEQVRSEFDRLRWLSTPIQARLIHHATNAEAEGVLGTPQSLKTFFAMEGAGHREPGPVRDSEGKLQFLDEAIVDVEGNAIVDPQGRAINFVMPASRSIFFFGDHSHFGLLSTIAERAGKAISQDQIPSLELLLGWRFSNWREFWWDFVFELAWSGRNTFLTAEKRLWLPAEKSNSFVPYNLTQLNHLASSGFGGQLNVPENWLKRLPDAWVSEIDDFVVASIDAADYILSELRTEAAVDPAPKSAVVPKSESAISEQDLEVRIQRRFAVALSFPGEHRKLLSQVANNLKNALGDQRVFYDKFHEIELAGPNLDLKLEQFYREQSDLIVVFVCSEYDAKEWCGIEWRAIREVIKSRRDEEVMFLRLDNGKVEGMSSLHGFIAIHEKSAREIADMIVRRWSASR